MDQFIEVNGHSIRYRKFGEGPNLLLLHTLRTQSEYFDKVIPELSKHFTIYSPDLPGHGESSKHEHLSYDATHFTETVVEFIKALDLNDLTIAGESIGATIALSSTLKIRDRISQVFAFNPHDKGSIIGGWIGRMASFLGRYTTKLTEGEKLPVLRKVLQGGFYNKHHLPNDFVELLFKTAKQDKRLPNVMKSIFQNQDSWEQTRELNYPKIDPQLPIHLIYGEHDWSARQTRRENEKNIPSVTQMITLEKTGHFSLLDNPARGLEIILGRRSIG